MEKMYDQIISTWRWKLREKPKNYRNWKNREVNNAFEMFISYHGKLRKLSVSMKIDQQKIKSLGSTFKNLKLEVEINLWHFHAFLIFSIIMSLVILIGKHKCIFLLAYFIILNEILFPPEYELETGLKELSSISSVVKFGSMQLNLTGSGFHGYK